MRAPPVSRASSMWMVLRAVWNLEPRAIEKGQEPEFPVPEVLEETHRVSGKPLAYTTVAFHLKALEGKGLVTARKQGRFYYYRSTLDEPAAVAEEIEAFFDLVIHDDPVLLESVIERASRRLKRATEPAARRRQRQRA